MSAFLYDSEGTLGVHTTTNTNFAVEPVSSFNIKPVNENVKDSEGNYWTTLITAFPYVIPSGGSVLGAYTVTATTDEDGKTFAVPTLLSSPGETVSAGTPVLLKLSGDADTWSLNLTGTHVIGTPDQKISDNLLSGVYFGNKVANDKDNYRVLGVNKSGTIGFYKYSGDTMNANKVWLDLSSVSGAKGSVFLDLDGEATGIDEIEEEPIVCEGVYDIQGRRVAETLESVSLPKGLYIVNGKKVFIK